MAAQGGVPLRRQGISNIELPEVMRLYLAGWSCQRLADRFECDDETVRQRLKTAGVVLRRP
jgi:DNA-directed RNA polymerase specialized sigma24 family protein